MLKGHKKYFLLVAVAATLTVLPRDVLVPAANPAAENEAVQMLVGHELGKTPMLSDLEEMCDRIGGRPTGSEACNRAVDWAVEKFKAAGVDSVHTEKYTLPSLWLGGKADAECLSPAKFPVHVR